MNIESFLDRVKSNSFKSKKYGKEESVKYYSELSGVDKSYSESFYWDIVSSMFNYKIVLSINEFQLEDLLRGRLVVKNSSEESSLLSLAGIDNNVFFAKSMIDPVVDGKKGRYAIVIKDIKDIIAVSTPISRVINPNSEFFVSDLDCSLYPKDSIPECMSTTAILGLTKSEALSSPISSKNSLLSDPNRGSCVVAIFQNITPDIISYIVTPSKEEAMKVRNTIGMVDRILPVIVGNTNSVTIDSPKKSVKSIKNDTQKYFEVGDRIATKNSTVGTPRRGTILDLSNGNVTIQWDGNKTRSIVGTTEALMSFMPEPSLKSSKTGMIVYNMDGMDNDTVKILCSLGIDPVSMFSLASHFSPPFEGNGWQELVIEALDSLGVKSVKVDGFVWEDDKLIKSQWVEGQLPLNNRLILDLKPNKIRVIAGNIENYIIPIDHSPFDVL